MVVVLSIFLKTKPLILNNYITRFLNPKRWQIVQVIVINNSFSWSVHAFILEESPAEYPFFAQFCSCKQITKADLIEMQNLDNSTESVEDTTVDRKHNHSTEDDSKEEKALEVSHHIRKSSMTSYVSDSASSSAQSPSEHREVF